MDSMSLDLAALDRTLEAAQRQLLAARLPQGFWRGELASSALATATAVLALTLAGRPEDAPLADAGRKWLLHHANPDGGWGDTPESLSNISTTLLAWCALGQAAESRGGRGMGILPMRGGGVPPPLGAKKTTGGTPVERMGETPMPPFRAHGEDVIARAEQWIAAQAGSLEPSGLAAAVTARYGRDRTFAVPILMACALAGRLGPARHGDTSTRCRSSWRRCRTPGGRDWGCRWSATPCRR